MTTRLPLVPHDSQEGGVNLRGVRSRLLIVCPLADIYSGVIGRQFWRTESRSVEIDFLPPPKWSTRRCVGLQR